MGKLALKYKKNFHIDACLGSYLHPFMRDAGYEIPACDFSVPGVTSISCDPHKYGYTPKGISVIMYSSPELRRLQYFVTPNWTGGVYITPTLSGSRSGCLAVGAWATILNLGREGYIHCTKAIIDASRYIKREIPKVPHLELMGDPLMSVVAFTSKTLNIYAVITEMSKIGHWGLNGIQNPAGAHICVTYANSSQLDKFIEDLHKAVAEVEKNPDRSHDSTCQLYGMVSEVADKSLVGKVITNYADCLFTA